MTSALAQTWDADSVASSFVLYVQASSQDDSLSFGSPSSGDHNVQDDLVVVEEDTDNHVESSVVEGDDLEATDTKEESCC